MRRAGHDDDDDGFAGDRGGRRVASASVAVSAATCGHNPSAGRSATVRLAAHLLGCALGEGVGQRVHVVEGAEVLRALRPWSR